MKHHNYVGVCPVQKKLPISINFKGRVGYEISTVTTEFDQILGHGLLFPSVNLPLLAGETMACGTIMLIMDVHYSKYLNSTSSNKIGTSVCAIATAMICTSWDGV